MHLIMLDLICMDFHLLKAKVSRAEFSMSLASSAPCEVCANPLSHTSVILFVFGLFLFILTQLLRRHSVLSIVILTLLRSL